MWLNNYKKYTQIACKVLLSPQGEALNVPTFRKITGTEVYTANGSREGINSAVNNNNPYSRFLNSLLIGAIGSLTTPAVNYNSAVSIAARVIFGSGSTPVDADDYQLASMITTGLTFSISSGVDEDTNMVTTNLSVTCTDSAKDVSEIGIAYDQVLLYRKVLDAPIHLEVGDSFIVRISVDLGTGNATLNV